MNHVANSLSLGIVVAGILAAAGTAARADLREGILVLLDFLLAAGLLRLSASGLGWRDIGSFGLIVAIRHLVAFGFDVHRRERRRTSHAGHAGSQMQS